MSGIPQSIGHVAPHQATLGTSFGDAPLGRVGNHQLSATNPGNPRVMQPTTGDKVKAFFERALNALTPKAMRADSKLQEATKALSRHLGDAMGGLAASQKTPENQQATKTALIKLTADAAEMTKRGVPFEEALQTRISQHLGQLGTKELIAIAKGASDGHGTALLGQLVAEDHHEAVVAFGKIATEAARLAEAKSEAATERQVDVNLQNALALVDTPAPYGARNAFLDAYVQVGSPALSHTAMLKNDLGAQMDGQAQAARMDGIVKDGLARMAPQDLEKLLTRVPVEDLAKYLAATSATGKDTSAVDVAIRQEVSNRTDKFADEIDHAQHNIYESNSGNKDFGTVVSNIFRGGEAVAALAKQDGLFASGKADTVATENLTLLKMAIGDAFSQPNISGRLEDLPPQDLIRMSKALGSLGMDDAKALVDAQITQRKNAADAKFQTAAAAFGASVMQGKTKDIVENLIQLHAALDKLAMAHQELGAKIADLGDRKDFADKAMQKAMDGLDPLTKQAIVGYTSLPEVQNMKSAMLEMGAEMQMSVTAMGLKLFNTAETLDMIGHAVGTPALETDPKASLADRLDSNARTALKENFGIILEGDRPKLTDSLKPVDQKFTDRTTQAFGERLKSVPSADHPTVDASFAKDVPRASFTILGKPMSKDVGEAANQMKAFASSPEELMAITGVMNQTSAIALANGLFRNLSGESAFAFADGTQFKPLSGDSGQSQMSFDVYRNEQGEPVVRVNMSYVNMTAVDLVPSGQRIPIPEGKVFASMEVTIRADGSSQITTAPHANVQISEFGRMLRDPNLASEASAFEAHVTNKQFSGENIAFWKMVETYRANPSLAGARIIMNQFIGDNSATQINIDSSTQRALTTAYANVVNGTATAKEMASLFDDAQDKIEGLMLSDSYPKYLKSKA